MKKPHSEGLDLIQKDLSIHPGFHVPRPIVSEPAFFFFFLKKDFFSPTSSLLFDAVKNTPSALPQNSEEISVEQLDLTA